MKINFDISSKEFYIIRDILQKHLTADYKVWVFGSRAKNQTKYNSDLDIALEHSTIISPMILASLTDDLDDSLLPYKVDIIDINEVSNSFKQIINKCKIPFPISLKKNIPQLRFPEFEGEWSIDKFKNLAKINQGLQISISERYTEQIEGSYFYITNEFLKKNSDKKYYILNPTESVLCGEDDVLMTRTGNTGQVVTNVIGVFHNNFFKIKFNNEQINKAFLVYFLKLYKTQCNILRLAGTSTIPDLNHSDFYRIEMRYPTSSEQTKIANFLTAIDNRIKTLEKKKTLLEQYKKGVMQKIFKQELRFKDDNGNEFEGEWEEKKLGEVSMIIMGQSPISGSYNSKADGTYLVQGNADITDRKTNPRNWTTKPTRLCEIGNLILTVRAPVGSIAKSNHNACIGRGVCAIKNNTKSNIEFLYQFLLSYEDKWIRLEQGSTFTAVTGKDINFLNIALPSIQEQQKIANFLSSIDKKIELTNKKIEHTKFYKKGLLQQMFV